MLGWIASIGVGSVDGNGGVAVHVAPPSLERSKWTRHRLGCSTDSVLLPATNVRSASDTGLFLIGPRIPSGSRRALLHVRPWSADVRITPHQRCGLGPTL